MGQILSSRADAVLTLELSNPGKANALDFAMLAALDEHIAQIGEDDTIRAVVLRGTAGGAFSSGADIREWSALDPQAFATQWIGEGNAVFRRFERLRCPTVAVIEGLCFGGGLELALCCDLRLAGAGARLRFRKSPSAPFPAGRAATACSASRAVDARSKRCCCRAKSIR